MKIISWSGQGALLLLIISTLGHRGGLIPFRVGVTLLVIGLLVCTLVAVVELFLLSVVAVKKKTLRLDYLLLAVACSLGPCLSLYEVGLEGFRAPRIHDITSDRLNPPEFLFTQQDEELRENSLIYGADGISAEQLGAIQLDAYPDIQTMIVPIAARRVYQKALFVGEVLGWNISAHDVVMLHFEAYATTALFGFVDDIVVRITPLDSQLSAIDIRSASREGISDIGFNAKRIRLFFNRLEEELIDSNAG